MTRLVIIISGFMLMTLQVASVRGQPSENRPNILWIVANDIGNELGYTGNSAVYTPHLDKLASEGIAYKNMITAGAVCSPSRSAFITGIHAVSINCHNQFPNKKTRLPDTIQPLPEIMRENGYYVANTGGVEMKGPYYTGYNFEHDPAKMYDGHHWSGRKPGQPFFAQVHLKYTHREFVRDTAHPVDPSAVKIPPYYPDHQMVRQDWAMYLETIQLLDREIGQILAKLDKDGLTENTVIFFFGDHGHPHIRGKQFLYEGGINAPLIVKGPGVPLMKEVSDALVSNIDIAATTLHIAGVQLPDNMQGISFLKDENQYVFAARDRCDETEDRIRMVRSKEFKLLRNFFPDRPYTQFNAYKKTSYPILTLMKVLEESGDLNEQQRHFLASSRPEFEFYDLKNDPFELNNLAEKTEYRTQFDKHKTVLDNWLKTADKGPYPEDKDEVEFAKRLMKKQYESTMKAQGFAPDVSDKEYLRYWEEKFRQWFATSEK